MKLLRFEPIANQISKWVSAGELLPPTILEELREGTEAGGEPRLPTHTLEFVCHYFALVRAGNDLLGAPPFERLSRLHEQIEEEYMPGGPPMSPVYDSFSLQHVLGQVPHGAGDETPYSVLARLTASDPRYRDFHELARALSAAHLDFYRVTQAEALTAEIELVRRPASGPARLTVHLTGPFLRTNDRMLARVVPFREKSFIADSPYLLKAPEQEWLDYFERVVASRRDAGSTSAAKAKAQGPKGKAATNRQAGAGTAQKLDPEQVITRHLKRGESERFWLDYAMDAYAGERNGIVFLAGVPDRPEQLPHSKHYVPQGDASTADSDEPHSPMAGVPPMARLRAGLIRIAEREGLTAQARNQFLHACENAGLPVSGPAQHEQSLFTSYCTLGARSARGLTALEHFDREHLGDERSGDSPPDAELQRVLESLKRGWFSVLRVERIHLDEALELFDTLRRKRLRVSERSATRQLAPGDLLLGWLCEDEQGVLTLEGGAMRVPSLLASQFIEIAKTLRDATPRQMDWRTRASHLPVALIVALRLVLANSAALDQR
ncbi:MAG TPA: hypothetical protein VIM73_00185 [Polyangiaceae bacterium]